MKLLWIFRAVFLVIIVSVLFIHISSSEISGESGRANFNAILWSGLALALAAFVVDFFTPKKSLAALAGVFFGLLVGIFISWCCRRWWIWSTIFIRSSDSARQRCVQSS